MKISEFIKEKVLLADGAMGTITQAANLSVEKDYLGNENCTDILTESRPDLIEKIHKDYFAAGADAVETNTFGASVLTLGEFGLQKKCRELNRISALVARRAADSFKDSKPRFVLGSVGPGTKLASLGHVDYAGLEDSFYPQFCGLSEGGVDAFLIETCQDPLQIKAAVNAARRALEKTGDDIPIFCQVTVEVTGAMLVGTSIGAAATIISAYDEVAMLGLNCATGPAEMLEHLKWLSEYWPKPISALPNAGLPEVVEGEPYYPLSEAELAVWQKRFVEELGVAMIGGCCGTTPSHIKALDKMLNSLAPGGRDRPAVKERRVELPSSLSSLYQRVPLRQDKSFFMVGERCNANGSSEFRKLQEKEDWEGCVAMARAQEEEGANGLDICAAFVGRDEKAEMKELVGRLRGAVSLPIFFDSTEYEVLSSCLPLYGGKGVINSINFESGEKPAAERLALAKKFGQGVLALTIDEEGMAKTAADKLKIAERLYNFCLKAGLAPSDLLFDPLTFTICTGNEEDRRLGLETLEGIRLIAEKFHKSQIFIGVSNISFGINREARRVLNSVFLAEAVKCGLSGAINHVSRILPLAKIPEREAVTALDLIYDRRKKGYDPLHKFLQLFSGRKTAKKDVKVEKDVKLRLQRRIIDGERQGLEGDLKEAMRQLPPLDIINKVLLNGMKVVGDLFGAGKMQLPFVLRSAETMKAAVGYLEPFMEKLEGKEKGTIVLATVRGDVHDIGKNLVDIILSNNGYKVVNLGIKQPISNILSAVQQHDADVVGMSGLLVKSTAIMRENLEEMNRQKLKLPVLLGGAALNRRYVVEQCAPIYKDGGVAYARDAFDGLAFMDAVKKDKFKKVVAEQKQRVSRSAPPAKSTAKIPEPSEPEVITASPARSFKPPSLQRVAPPNPPFFGSKLISSVPISNLLPFLNENTLYQFHWGYKKSGRTLAEFKQWAKAELKPMMLRLAKECEDKKIITPKAAYGYFRCAASGDSLLVFADENDTEPTRFNFPRQQQDEGLCIADYFLPLDEGGDRDVVALQAVTVGARASQVERKWFAEDRYRDYLYLHGLSVELTEALAEYVHRRIRRELGLTVDEQEAGQGLKQKYRGARYSFGYPACPNLAEQRRLLKLIGGKRLGITISASHQLHPEQSTTAVVAHHPQAGYFTIKDGAPQSSSAENLARTSA